MDKLIFYGPTGKGLPTNKIGGGEKGCQRTIALYEKLGLSVVTVEKPTLGRGKKIFIREMIITPFVFLFELCKHSQTPVHIVGFYENQLYYEFMLFLMAKTFRRKITYELRNGTMVRTFFTHSSLYRKVMQSIIEHSDVVLCQGIEYMEFIHKLWSAFTIYYPNYVMDIYLHPYNENR